MNPPSSPYTCIIAVRKDSFKVLYTFFPLHNTTQAFAILTVVALVFQWVWLLLFLLFDWNKNIHTTLIFSGVAKGIANEVKEAL